MTVNPKIRRGKGIIAFCLLLVSIFTVGFAQSASAAPVTNPVTLEVKQSFIKSGAPSAGDTFTYKLTAKETGNPMPSGSVGDVYTFTISDTNSIHLPPISFTQVGVYNYGIEQVVASEKTGYTCDKQAYTVSVYVMNAGSGSFETEVIISNGDEKKAEDIEFKNKYIPLPSDPLLMSDPPVEKTVSGNPDKAGTFTFKLEAGNTSNPMPSGSVNGVKTLTIAGSGKDEFGTWSYTEAGTYYYKVSEVNSGEKGYTYDTAAYTITDSVKDVDGQLVLTRTVTNDANKQVNACTFINKYSAPGGGGGTNGPKTGDDAMTGLYTVTLGISGLMLIACMVYLLLVKRKKKASINV